MKNKVMSGIALLLLLVIGLKVYADSYSVVATNTTTQTVGTILINLTDNTHPPLFVGPSGDYSTSVEVTLVSVTINGQTVNVGNQANVTLPNSTVVHVTVSSGSSQITVQIQGGG